MLKALLGIPSRLRVDVFYGHGKPCRAAWPLCVGAFLFHSARGHGVARRVTRRHRRAWLPRLSRTCRNCCLSQLLLLKTSTHRLRRCAMLSRPTTASPFTLESEGRESMPREITSALPCSYRN